MVMDEEVRCQQSSGGSGKEIAITKANLFESEVLHIPHLKSKPPNPPAVSNTSSNTNNQHHAVGLHHTGCKSRGKSDHQGQFVDGTCFFLVACSALRTPSVTTITTAITQPPVTIVHSTGLCERQESLHPGSTKFYVPYHSYETFGNATYTTIHIPTKETSLSSGVASVDSSELSLEIPNPKDFVPERGTHPLRINDVNIEYMNSASPLAGKNIEVIVSEHDFEKYSNRCTNCIKNIDKHEFKTQTTQTDHEICCPCPCIGYRCKQKSKAGDFKNSTGSKNRTSLNSSTDSSRRDSGFSSLSATSIRTPTSPVFDFSLNSIDEDDVNKSPAYAKRYNSVDVILREEGDPLNQQLDDEKERLLESIKRNIFDPNKELLLLELKKLLVKSKLDTFSKDVSFKEKWTPIFSPKKSLKSVLKNQECPKTTQARKSREPLRRSEVIDIILEIRQCLDIINKITAKPCETIILQRNFQVHRKIRLKSYPFLPNNKNNDKNNNQIQMTDPRTKYDNSITRIENIQNLKDQNNTKEGRKESSGCCCHFPKTEKNNTRDENEPLLESETMKPERKTNVRQNIKNTEITFPLHGAARDGDIKKILELMQSVKIEVNEKDDNGWPAIHHALKSKHYRTAFLLLEAGADLKDYTQQQIKEYREMKEVIDRNQMKIT